MEIEFFAEVAGLAAIGVVVVQQILKLKFIPANFANKYPVPTNIVLSVIASLIAVWQASPITPVDWQGWVILVTTVSVVAAMIYNNVLKNWTELRATEGV